MAVPSAPPAPPGVPECPICFSAYDNAFRSPLQLPPCTHTFCLQCLAQMCLFLKPPQSFQCPLCRAHVPLPTGGAPCLPPNMEVVSQLPLGQRGGLQRVWLEGSQLCYWKTQSAYSPKRLIHDPGEDMVVRLQLTRVAPGTSNSGPLDLVTVWTPRWLRCREVWRSFWFLTTMVTLSFIILFCTIFFPIYILGRGP
ncbi:RING finger protein 223 isoform X2 [Amia ocellicauda]|uniref:RING finger protein 223 isoform X2 n=1 Tax=Amia ocellicauda TaxID=2972642 RepID=UPI00346465FE